MTKKYLFISLVLILIFQQSTGQELIWKAGFNSFFDNREYFNNYAEPGSILGARTFVEGGFAIDKQNSFSVGVNFMYEFGDEFRDEYVNPIMYYKHNSKSTDIYMGAFPRKGLFELPYMMQSDTFNYYRPNVEGIFLNFKNSWGKQSVWLDWTSRQTVEARETFLIGGTGQAGNNRFFGRYDFIMYHFAGDAENSVDEGVRDNGGVTAVLGANLTGLVPLDTFVISTGATMSYDRIRSVYELQYTYGSYSELVASYKKFGVKNTLYVGDGQVNLVGDKMYTAPFYNRTDLTWNIFGAGRVEAEVEFSLHFLPETTDFSQKFTIYIDINGRRKLNHQADN